MRIVIADYSMGNIRSIVSALNFIGVNDVVVSAEHSALYNADKIILPGVGSFGKAVAMIKQTNLDDVLHETVLAKKKPILGICLGMQLLGMSSTEDGENGGLSFINGVVRKFDVAGLTVPHVGFNQVKAIPDSRLYDGLPEMPDFYFTHSYRMTSEDDINASMCDYGGDFIASYESENIAGVQFHPELSQYNGLNLIRNFINKF